MSGALCHYEPWVRGYCGCSPRVTDFEVGCTPRMLCPSKLCWGPQIAIPNIWRTYCKPSKDNF